LYDLGQRRNSVRNLNLLNEGENKWI
jgi:hypothetical protein